MPLPQRGEIMKKPIFPKLENVLILLVVLLIPVHLIGSYINAIDSIDKGDGHSYSMMNYLLITLWLLIVIAVDAFIIFNKGFIASKALKGYWGISAVILIVVFCIRTTDSLLIALLLLLTPYGVLFPVLERFFVVTITANSLIIVILFCIFNWCICKFASDSK